MKNVAAFVLAGGRVAELGVLTLRRAKAALPFAGMYRVVDFAMSNLAVSGVDRVGVLSQYRLSSLMDHIGTGEPWGIVGRHREARILSPFQAEGNVDWYRGTADAVYRNLNFLRNEDRVLIVSGDHVYHMDYRPLLEEHVRKGAELTMVFKRFPRAECTQFGTAVADADGRVVQYEEKPRVPQGDLGSLTIYLFEREVLERALDFTMRAHKETYHLYEDVIPYVVARGRAQAHVFGGYWAYTRTVDDYYRASMDVLRPESGLDLERWEVWTNPAQSGTEDEPPVWVGAGATVEDARLCAGCEVRGTVVRSILSAGVVVEEGAVVRDSVLMNDVRVGRGSTLERVVADKHVRIGADCQVGHAGSAPAFVNGAQFHRSGVVAIGREAELCDGCRVGANCQVAPAAAVPAHAVVPDGEYCERKGEEPWFVHW